MKSHSESVTTKIKDCCKVVKPLKSEEWEQDRFQCDVSSGMIFIWGGGMEGCVSPRVMKIFVEFLKKKKVI